MKAATLWRGIERYLRLGPNGGPSIANPVLPANGFLVYQFRMSEFISVHITASSPAEAEKIASKLVEEKLAACVNILPGAKSIYRWEGKIETAAEAVLIAKTRADLFEALNRRVKALHSYSCPCIVALPIIDGDQAYLGWLAAETK
jgi:periplasmic divalent cation tolerance protein